MSAEEVITAEQIIKEVEELERKGKVYILNTLAVPLDWDIEDIYDVTMRRISVQKAKEIIAKKGFISAVEHEATAKLLTELLGVEVPVNRIQVKMTHGDKGIHFALKTRIPEGKVLTLDELKQIGYHLVLSKIV
ncbi:MAG: STIV orfB116 family protein [Thermoproteota archaeon]